MIIKCYYYNDTIYCMMLHINNNNSNNDNNDNDNISI